jgi:predicted transcriptional regulator
MDFETYSLRGIHMACVNPDGTLSKTAVSILKALETPLTVEEISKKTGAPIFLLRSSMRDLVDAGVAEVAGDKYVVTEKGRAQAK